MMNKEQQRDFLETFFEKNRLLSGPNATYPEVEGDSIYAIIESPFIDGLSFEIYIDILSSEEYDNDDSLLKEDLLYQVKKQINENFLYNDDEYFAQLGFSAGMKEELDPAIGNKLLANIPLFEKTEDYLNDIFS